METEEMETFNPINILHACAREEKRRKKRVSSGKLLSSTIFEQIRNADGSTGYALYEQMADRTWRLSTTIAYENYIPMPQNKNPLTTPYKPIEYESEQNLWNEVKAYVHKHLDIPNPAGYDILTGWIFSTWINEIFDFTAYLGFFGREATGKSRALEVINQLCFRAWFTTGLTTATLFRLVERFSPTLLLDESEFLNAKERKELVSLLNAGQRRGVLIPRMKGDHYEDVELFSVYCPKAISGTEQLRKTTRSRMIIFNMTKNVRAMPKLVDKEAGAKLRSKLLMWRFKKLSALIDKQPLDVFEVKARTKFNELEKLSGRSYELFYPLMYCAPTQETRKAVADFAAELERIKTREERTEISNLVFEAIVKLQPKAERGLIYLRHITAYVNSVLDIQFQYGSKTVGKIVTQMGFQKVRRSKGIAVILDEALIRRLRKDPRYALELADYFNVDSVESVEM